MVYVFSTAIRIAYGDPDGGKEDGRDDVHKAVKSGGYCAKKTTPIIKILARRVIHHRLTPATSVCWKRIDHRASSAQRKRRPWSIDAD